MNAVASGCLAGLLHYVFADSATAPLLWRAGLSTFFGLGCGVLSIRLRRRYSPNATMLLAAALALGTYSLLATFILERCEGTAHDCTNRAYLHGTAYSLALIALVYIAAASLPAGVSAAANESEETSEE